MTHTFWTMGDYDNALTCGQRALTLAAATGDAVQQARVNGFLGTVYFSLGDYRRAIDVFRQAIPSYEGELRHERFRGMMIASVRDRLWLLQCCAELGAFAEGIAYGEEAARIAETAGHLTSAVMTQDRLGLLAFRQGDLQHAIVSARTRPRPVSRRGYPALFAWDYGHFGFGLCAVRAGHRGAAPARPGRGTANHRRRRGPCHAPPGRGLPPGRSCGGCAPPGRACPGALP